MNYIKQFFQPPNSLSYFAFENDGWKIENCKNYDQKLNNKQISFLTYNVWFEKHNFNERVIEILKIIQQNNCDFVCLQEVTRDFQIMMSNDKFIQSTYFITGNVIKGYGILILSKFKPTFIIELPFNSQFGRTFLYLECQINGHSLVVGTSHLESMVYNEQARYDQLQTTYKELEKYKNVIIMGDFNLETQKDEQSISPQYADLWKQLYPDNPGYTFIIDDFKRRFDRILLKKGGSYQASNIEILGTKEIPLYKDNKPSMKGEVKTPSDHYALKLHLQYLL
ncbi:unnamed protein product (macronuclear) [Paramecium tetraurelia]|uniref:Endonuclease/exonuclease/phosphatase domain-containing protein n=1 Tax=Paramecium tetraurelia TaxID=5888 RepID=A0EBB5_PARTE|nr:uncharacterized protein GSPATT00025316001 [Paramecium tetraurelia]CAK92582.1 unnamed protein product [Paramecium tetraurelia]|eukprot:XP_001459979.1 hypothetical protein (macronuclear) [Paramecium tetraurelia strain d4-2]